jgi:anti-sigma factor RsiW
MHLHGHTLTSYLAGDLDASRRARLDAHVRNCLQCAHTLAEHGASDERWERRGWLGRLVRVPA